MQHALIGVSWPDDVSALCFSFRRHVPRIVLALSFKLKAQTTTSGKFSDWSHGHRCCWVDKQRCIMSLFFSIVHLTGAYLPAYTIESRSRMEKAVLLHVCSFLCHLAPRMHKIKIHHLWKAFRSAAKLLSSSEHRPNQMLTIASLEYPLLRKIDLNISLADVRSFRLFWFACHTHTKT